MIRFVHTADIHFGMENYGRPDAQTGIHSRLLDFERALDFCVDYAIKENVDLFLFAGDAYKTANPSPTHQRMFMKCLLKLYTAGIPIVMVVGNHDHPLTFGKTHALEIFGQLPVSGFYVINKPEILVVQTKSGPVQIVGIPWPTRNSISLNNIGSLSATELTQYISTGVSSIISDLAEKVDDELPAILCGHLTVSSGIFSGSEKRAIYGTDPVFLPSELALYPFDYVALGHLHRYQNLNENGHPAVVYSGSIERIDFGERKEDKGFCLVTIKDKKNTSHTFIKTPTRPFIQVELHIAQLGDQTQQIIDELKNYDLAGAVIKIIYHLPAGVKDQVNINAIQQACIDAWYIVGVIPVRTVEIRERRAALKVDMDLTSLLSHYFESKLEYKSKKQKLIDKALELQATMNQPE